MTPSKDDGRRRDYQRLGVGSALVGGTSLYRARNVERAGMGDAGQVARTVAQKRSISGKEARFLGRHLAVGGAAATGLSLAVAGAQKKRRKVSDRMVVSDEVVGSSIKRTVPLKPSSDSVKEKAKALPVLAGAALGGVAGRKLGTKHLKSIAGRSYAGRGIGGAGGIIAGGIATDASVDQIRRMRSERSVPVDKRMSAQMSPQEERDRRALRHSRKVQQGLSLTSAGLGITALGMKAPQITRMAMRSKAPQKLIAAEKKMDTPSNLVGTGAIGVGSMGSLNFARTSRKENEIETKYGLKKDYGYTYEEISKLGVPRIKPVRFAGVKAGGFFRRANGTTGYRRGSLG